MGILLGGLLLISQVTAAQAELRAVLASRVACRGAPTRSADSVSGLDIGNVLWVRNRYTRHVPPDGSETWVLAGGSRIYRTCWVAEHLTTPVDPRDQGATLLAIADYVLASSKGRDTADFVRAHNLFVQGGLGVGHETVDVAASPILSLRKLQLVAAAVARVDRRAHSLDPLVLGWLLSHGDRVRYFEPGALWYVPRSAYREIYERFRDGDMAEELLWEAARQPRYDDCEGSSDCYLARPIESVATYWIEYPQGRFVTDAVSMALGQLPTLKWCSPHSGFDAASPEVIATLRDSLLRVDDEVKRPRLDRLKEIEGGCRQGAAGM